MSVSAARICDYVGKKDKLLELYNSLRPQGKIKKTWEPCAGTLSCSLNWLIGLSPEQMYATEKYIGMYSLLHAIKNNPVELFDIMKDLEYSDENYLWAEKHYKNDFAGLDELEIAKAQYILCNMSINGIVGEYRDIDKGAEDDWKCFCVAQQARRRFQKQILKNIMQGHERLQQVQLRHGDMLDEFDAKAADADMYIVADIPYTNDTRSEKLYPEDTDSKWHENFVKRIIRLRKCGKLKANLMICNYCKKELKNDPYCELLKYGFTLIKVKEVDRPTVIHKNEAGKKRNKATEYVFVNYETACEVSRDRIFTCEDVFGN